MTDFTEVNAENLKFVRGAKGMTQEAVAEVLGVPINAISKIESGSRGLAASEKKLLDLYFFGIMPKGIIRTPEDLASTLDFTPTEWKIIQIMATRAGQSVEDWVRSQILASLAFSADTAPLDQSATPPASGEVKRPVAGGKRIAATSSHGRPPGRESAA